MGIGGVPCPKPEPRKRTKARVKRQKGNREAEVRVYVFARERDICRCCRKRRAESMHEIIFRSQGGKVSRFNSIAVCGDGVRGCHGFMQRHEIDVYSCAVGAEGFLEFTVKSENAAEWVGIPLGDAIISETMVDIEAAE